MPKRGLGGYAYGRWGTYLSLSNEAFSLGSVRSVSVYPFVVFELLLALSRVLLGSDVWTYARPSCVS